MSGAANMDIGTNEPVAEPVVRISLAMSGAISAGAYTAGALDFLLRALAEWNANRPPGSQAVRLVAFSGASAGGITAALGTVAAAYGLDDLNRAGGPVLHTQTMSSNKTIECVLPKLYSTWVIRPCMVSEDGLDLLSSQDIDETKEVRSLLNWKALDRIRDEALAPVDAASTGVPKASALFADPFHLYLTISNLRGIPYVIGSQSDQYRMLDHGDRMHFSVAGLGTDAAISSTWARCDSGHDLKVADLAASAGTHREWKLLGDSALATAAFPVGLSARPLRGTVDFNARRQWPAYKPPGTAVTLAYPDKFPHPEEDFGFVNVDGGMINNDPFEFARYTLLDNWRDPDPHIDRTTTGTDRLVVMISPFPEGARFDANDPVDASLMAVLKRIVPALIQQARFKPSELAAAADATIASRWIIAPRRSDQSAQATSADIACGLLGGFGGFLDRSFREHDYQLGQRNCQQFLREGLTLDGSNSNAFGAAAAGAAGKAQPVVPLTGSAVSEIPLPDWPAMTNNALDTLIARIGGRADNVIAAMIKQDVGSGVLRAGGRFLWWYKRDAFLTIVRSIIYVDLIKRAQIDDGLKDLPRDDQRRLWKWSGEERSVLACLADAAFDLRTPDGIGRVTKLPVPFVKQTLAKAMALPPQAVHAVWQSGIAGQNGQQTYTLCSRKLPFYQIWWVVGPVVRSVKSVKID